MTHEQAVKRVSLETAANTLNKFSPPQLIYPETRQVAEGDFDALGLHLDDAAKNRLQSDANKYRQHIRMIRRELGHRTLLCIANNLTQDRESGLYVDSSSISTKKASHGVTHDLSAVNWEYTPDGFLSRGKKVIASSETEFGVWDIRYVKAASISNAIRESNGHYSHETLALDDATDDSIILTYSSSSQHMRVKPFHDAFTSAPGESI